MGRFKLRRDVVKSIHKVGHSGNSVATRFEQGNMEAGDYLGVICYSPNNKRI